jgi:hypothetical protein
MKFRNPWVDPRVLQLKATDAEAYLANHGWKPMTPYSTNVTAYSRSGDAADGPIVYVPTRYEAIEYPQRMIELVAALAFAEDRWAVDVLSDILQAKNAPTPINGTAAQQATETAAS